MILPGGLQSYLFVFTQSIKLCIALLTGVAVVAISCVLFRHVVFSTLDLFGLSSYCGRADGRR
jgi:hypothetical protein